MDHSDHQVLAPGTALRELRDATPFARIHPETGLRLHPQCHPEDEPGANVDLPAYFVT